MDPSQIGKRAMLFVNEEGDTEKEDLPQACATSKGSA
jgi:hypothetical protein